MYKILFMHSRCVNEFGLGRFFELTRILEFVKLIT